MNWGKGITIFMAAFIGFILFMVFKASKTSTDLQAEDYYQQEISYQNRIDAINNAKILDDELRLEQKEKQVIINFPADFADEKVEGNIYFFKPENAGLDITFKIELTDNQQVISKNKLVKGLYSVKVEWNAQGKPYFTEQTLEVS